MCGTERNLEIEQFSCWICFRINKGLFPKLCILCRIVESVGLHNFWLFTDMLRQMLLSQTPLLCSGNDISSAYMKQSWNHQSLVLI